MRKFALALAVVASVAVPAFAGKYNKKVSVGDKAPTFSGIPAICNGEDVSVSLPDIKEDVVVVFFTANHCPAVQACEDRIVEFTNAYKGKSVKVVGLSVSDQDIDKLPKIKEYMKEHASTYTYGWDETQATGKAYGAAATPQFFVLDKTRTIRYMGAMDDSVQKESDVKKTYVKDAVDALLDGKEIEVTETRAIGCGISYKR